MEYKRESHQYHPYYRTWLDDYLAEVRQRDQNNATKYYLVTAIAVSSLFARNAPPVRVLDLLATFSISEL